MKTATAAKPITLPTANRLDHACKKFWRSRYLLLMLLPALIWYIVFMYAPMYGAQIAFRDFSPVLGITGSKWVGFKYFTQFFKSEYFGRLIKNTLGISLYSIIVGFPIPIILALLINEVRGKFFKRSVQTVVYLPPLHLRCGRCQYSERPAFSFQRPDQSADHRLWRYADPLYGRAQVLQDDLCSF